MGRARRRLPRPVPRAARATPALSCEIDGILPTVCTVIGGMMATEALKLLTGVGEPLIGRVAVYDALQRPTREIAYRRAADAAARPPAPLE